MRIDAAAIQPHVQAAQGLTVQTPALPQPATPAAPAPGQPAVQSPAYSGSAFPSGQGNLTGTYTPPVQPAPTQGVSAVSVQPPIEGSRIAAVVPQAAPVHQAEASPRQQEPAIVPVQVLTSQYQAANGQATSQPAQQGTAKETRSPISSIVIRAEGGHKEKAPVSNIKIDPGQAGSGAGSASGIRPWIAVAVAVIAAIVLANLPSLTSGPADASPSQDGIAAEEATPQGGAAENTGDTPEPGENTAGEEKAENAQQEAEIGEKAGDAPVVPTSSTERGDVTLGSYKLSLDGYGRGSISVIIDGLKNKSEGTVIVFTSYDKKGRVLDSLPVIGNSSGKTSVDFATLLPKGKKESDVAAVVVSSVAGAETGADFEEARKELAALRAEFDARNVTPDFEEVSQKADEIDSEVVMGDTEHGDGGGYNWESTHTWDDTVANDDGSLSRWKPGYSSEGGKYFIAHDYGPYGPAIMGLSSGDKVTVDGVEYTIIGYFDIARTGTAEEVRELLGGKVTCFQTCNGPYYRVAYGKESAEI